MVLISFLMVYRVCGIIRTRLKANWTKTPGPLTSARLPLQKISTKKTQKLKNICKLTKAPYDLFFLVVVG